MSYIDTVIILLCTLPFTLSFVTQFFCVIVFPEEG